MQQKLSATSLWPPLEHEFWRHFACLNPSGDFLNELFDLLNEH